MSSRITHIGLLLIACIGMWGGVSVYAASDDFTVSATVTGAADVTAPSIPSGLTATAMSVSQIDLLWTASTDDVAVAGYKVFRDAVQIATSTVTTYSDTGLTASTTYTYTVAAFDATGNVSGLSASADATTLASTQPPDPDDETASGGGGMVGGLVSLYVTPGMYNAHINWETRTPVRYHIRWGRTASYELGFLSTELFAKVHATQLTGLSPDTQYEFMLITVDQYGNERVLAREIFRTLAGPDLAPPANVLALEAMVEASDDVHLTWQNPHESDFSHVRILRSPLFYPSDPYDGALIYEGEGESFLDIDALRVNDRAYYTAFSVDDNGNISSGAIATARRAGVPLEEEREPSSTPIPLSLADIQFIQDGKIVTLIEDENGEYLTLKSSRPFTVLIPYGALFENLKTIIVTLAHPEDTSKKFSFLLRINEEKTAYEAQIAPLVEGGFYPTGITVIDYALREMADVRTTIFVSSADQSDDAISAGTAWGTGGRNSIMFAFFLLILFALGYWLIRRDHYTYA